MSYIKETQIPMLKVSNIQKFTNCEMFQDFGFKVIFGK